MKIIIFYASYGGGHLNAAKSIENYLQTNYPNFEIELIDCMKYVNIGIEKITTTAYKEITKKMPWAWGKLYADSQKGILAHISSRTNKLFAIKLLKLLREKKPDIIISTHFFGSQMCSYLKRKGKITSKLATILTDFAPHGQWLIGSDNIDYYFVAHHGMKNYLISQNISEEKVFVTGIPISNRFLLNFNKQEILDNFNLPENKKNILFFGGGEFGLGKTRTVEIFESLIKNSTNYSIIAVAGKNEKMKQQFQNIVEKYQKQENIRVLGFTNQVPELMHISEFVVTKPGGLTTSESLACNLPMVIINPLPGQEEENAKLLVKNGIAIWIKKDDNPKEIFEKFLAHPENLIIMKKNTNILAKPFSTKNICKIILGENIEQKRILIILALVRTF